MLVYTRHVEPLGFKSSSMFSDSKCSTHYHKKLPAAFSVMIVSNDTGDAVQLVQVFRLKRRQYYEFELGKLSLIPSGCCNPSGGKSIGGPDIMFRGRFKNAKHVKDVVSSVEQILLNERRIECESAT
jgi:hypothetical protein